jgi:NAD(P)H-hydrate repair Nnr-like enzyme with NAD(P)H-hydrate dehydratase domain
MDAQQFSPNTTVAEALQQGRQISSVFTKFHTACVGCYLTHFCTLADVAKTYELSLEDLVDELRLAVQTTHPLIRSKK